MEPIGLVASLLTLAHVANKIGKAISRLRKFGEVPQQVYALKNEVSDLEVVLRQVGQALQSNALPANGNQAALESIVGRIKSHLTALGEALDRAGKAAGSGNVYKVLGRAPIWWKWDVQFQKFQTDIRTAKENLNLILGVSNSRDLNHIFLELRQITLMAANSQVLSNQQTWNLDQHQSALVSLLDRQYQGVMERFDALSQEVRDKLHADDEKSKEPPGYYESSAHETVRVLVSHRSPCRSYCPCSCHAKRKTSISIPGPLESLVGKLFVGYTGLPFFSKKCDFRGCKDEQTVSATFEYWFPWWFVSKNMKVDVKYLPSLGPQLQLSTVRRVPDDAPSISFAMSGNIEGLKYLFSEGLASPRDVSNSRGFTLMRWALYGGMHQHETVKFLISQGATVDENSYDNVWDFVFRGKCNETEERMLRCVTESGDGDWVEEQNFPLVHRIIFGLSPKLLAVELEERPDAVYMTDSQGRTALDWATARVQLDEMALLLAHGADPNNMDVTGRTAVLHAVDSHNVPCLTLILEGGGNPNPKMPKGIFRSSPLTAAGFGGMPEMLKVLLKFGADPNACNPEGLTALHSVARTKSVDCALLLLEWGADLNAVSQNGVTPLTTAIMHNNHAVLRLFVDRGFEYVSTSRLYLGPQLLPIIAEYSDKETMSILASSQPLKLSYDLSVDGLTAAHEILQRRRDCNEELSQAFKDLIAIAEAGYASVRSIDSLQEAGLVFYSARSSFHSDLADALYTLESTVVSPISPVEGFLDEKWDVRYEEKSKEEDLLVHQYK
ncbi:Ankyrin-1 [Arthrobotrys entomopaga]|nr:Ankyrin-1 [Arthrobotrys entomopaga]